MLRVVLILLLLPTVAFAAPGAWLQPKGKGQLIVNTLGYSSSERFDLDTKRVDASDYTKYELNPYVEYGLTDNITLGGNVFLQHVESANDSNYGLAEAEIFARGLLFTYEDSVIALQPMIKIPGLRAEDSPALGSKNPDVGISIISGHNLWLFGLPVFLESETGFRYRFGAAHNQYRANITWGMHVTPEFLVLAQGFSTWRNANMRSVPFTQSSADDYDLVKAQLSGVYQYSPTTAFQFGVFKDVYGANTGAGQGVLFSVWRNF